MTIQAGEVHALIGPNGAGKSTFFNMISGVDDPTEGQVRLMDKVMGKSPSRALGTGPHLPARAPAGSAQRGGKRRFGRAPPRAQGLDRFHAAPGPWRRGRLAGRSTPPDRALWPGEFADAPAASLALGQQRIVEIARALAGQPAVLLLDEPAAGLRHLEKRALADLLTQLRAEGLGILVVEHDMEFVMNLADRITVLEFGTVIAEGTPNGNSKQPARAGRLPGRCRRPGSGDHQMSTPHHVPLCCSCRASASPTARWKPCTR